SNGNIVTNQHVVDGASSISVKFWNGSTYTARVVGTDPSTDLAVIHVDAPSSALSPLAMGDSSQLQVGDGIVAIGSPFGLEEPVTSQLGMPAGVEVAQVRTGTPAAKAGLHGSTGTRRVGGAPYAVGGDVITRVDGKRVTSAEELQSEIGSRRPGTTVSITYVR